MSEHPKRIQRKRTKGWRMPPGAIYVGRTARIEGTGWSNPFRIGGYFMLGDPFPSHRFRMEWCQSLTTPPAEGFTRIVDNKMAVDWYRLWAQSWSPEFIARCRRELRGKDLACWCPLVDKDGQPVPCHADVLLELANDLHESSTAPGRAP